MKGGVAEARIAEQGAGGHEGKSQRTECESGHLHARFKREIVFTILGKLSGYPCTTTHEGCDST